MHSMLMFLFGLSSTAFKTPWLKFKKKIPNVLVHPTRFSFSCAVSKRGSVRWAHLAGAGSESERRIHFILPTGAACYRATGVIPQYLNLTSTTIKVSV